MDLRLDVHAFTEICEAVRHGEPIMLHGTDSKGKITRLNLSPTLVRAIERDDVRNHGSLATTS